MDLRSRPWIFSIAARTSVPNLIFGALALCAIAGIVHPEDPETEPTLPVASAHRLKEGAASSVVPSVDGFSTTDTGFAKCLFFQSSVWHS